MSLTPEESVAMHEELQQGDSLYVSETAMRVLAGMNEAKKEHYWEVDYSFMTYSEPSEYNLTEFTDCSIGVMAKDKYELLGKLGAFMEYQAGVRDGIIDIVITRRHDLQFNAVYAVEKVKYDQSTKAFTPVVLN